MVKAKFSEASFNMKIQFSGKLCIPLAAVLVLVSTFAWAGVDASSIAVRPSPDWLCDGAMLTTTNKVMIDSTPVSDMERTCKKIRSEFPKGALHMQISGVQDSDDGSVPMFHLNGFEWRIHHRSATLLQSVARLSTGRKLESQK